MSARKTGDSSAMADRPTWLTGLRGVVFGFPILYKVLVGNILIYIGYEIAEMAIEGESESYQFMITGFFVVVIVSYLVFRFALRPFAFMEGTTRRLERGERSARVPQHFLADAPTSQLIRTINQMLDQIEENTQIIERQKTEVELLAERVLTAQEDERRRIARELHDETSQVLTMVCAGLDFLDGHLPDEDEAARERLIWLHGITEQAIDRIHELIFNLRPSMLDDLGLAPALRNYVHDYQDRAGIATRFDCPDDLGRLPVAVETAFYRIAQEGLTNVARHAHASQAVVQISRNDGSLVLSVSDDGCGFRIDDQVGAPVSRKSLGLFGVRERANLLHGTCDITSEPNEGTVLTVRIPLQAEVPA